ncbi:MAG: arginine N-succinyltransferase [Phycisphaerales bacterium]|nr:arginine N-succinyltransferase [Phycisphaerales bacterium]
MYVIRQARPDDASILLKLARMVHFINLPADPEIIADKIRRSQLSFEGSITDLTRAIYMFAIEDDTTGNLLGTSQIIPQIGTPEAPNTYFQVRSRTMYADDLQQGMTHTTLQLGSVTDGPTEVGGLILAPSYRGHPAKLGKTLSLIRFHYMGLHPERFRDELLAEMMARLTPEGTNAFWEHLGRRFINLTYTEADRLSTRSKGFILKLMPHEEIYVTILPPEARMLIGKVGKDTEPAKAMLERMGFKYEDHIDPFDGGPHLHAKTADVSVVRDTKRLKLGKACTKAQAKGEALVSFDGEDGFRAVATGAMLSSDGKCVRIPRDEMKAIHASEGDRVGFTLLSKGERKGGRQRRRA